jgi:hypothetical protein
VRRSLNEILFPKLRKDKRGFDVKFRRGFGMSCG